MEKTRLICPCCGAEFMTPEKEHLAAGIAVGEDSGLGTIEMPLKKPGTKKSAEDRLAALKAAGFDTSGLYAMKSAAGEESLVRIDEHGMKNLDDDPIIFAILESGTVPEKRLFRRWVTAQMFRIIQSCNDENAGQRFDNAIRRRGARYMWNMAAEEYRVQMVIAKNDDEAYRERHMLFSRAVAVKMTDHYMKQLVKKLKRIRKLSKGIATKDGEDTAIINENTYAQLTRLADDIRNAKTPYTLYHKFNRFKALRPEFKDESVCTAWYDAFRGTGGYYTLKNLILFSGLEYHKLKGEKAAEALRKHADYLVSKGCKFTLFYEMLDVLKEGGINIAEKRTLWAIEAMNKRDNRTFPLKKTPGKKS